MKRTVRLFSARVRDSILCESAGDEQLKVDYPVDFSAFTEITRQDISDMRGKGETGLDDLYKKYLLKKDPKVSFRRKML